MKFLFIAPRLHTNFYYPIKILLENNHQVDFFVLYKGVSEQYDLVEPKVLGYSRFFEWWNKLRNPTGGNLIKTQYELRIGFPPIFSFFSSLLKYKPDVLIIKDITTNYAILALIGGFLFRKKMIVFTQIPKHRKQIKSGAVLWLWRLFKTRAITPVLGNQNFKNDNHNLIYMPFIIPADKSPRKYFTPDGCITILCVGKFQERKNQFLLLQAFNQLKKDFPIRLRLIGQKDEVLYFSEIKKYIKENELESKIQIFNNISWDKMGEFYRNSDVFVLPSFNEAAAYSLLEAMSYGLPVLSSNDNGTQFYIKEGENGFVFNPFDCTDLTAKLREVISDKVRLIAMGKRSLELTEKNHDPDGFYHKLLQLVETK